MNDPEQSKRAVALVAAALAIGLVVLGLGFDGVGTDLADGPRPTPTLTPTPAPTVDPFATPTPTPTATPTPSPTPDPDLREQAGVRVLVANATDVIGRAATATDLLIAQRGYNAFPANVNRDVNALPFAVYHLADYDANAREVADLLGIDRSLLGPMPADPPVDDLDDAHVLVILGIDPPDPEASPEVTAEPGVTPSAEPEADADG